MRRYPVLTQRLGAVVLAAVVAFGAAEHTKGYAMGAAQNPAMQDMILPDIPGVQGYVARDDERPLKAGQGRLYRVRLAAPGAGLPDTVLAQARAVVPLAALPVVAPGTDVAAQAAAMGAGPAQLARLQFGAGKYAMPNSLLAFDSGSDRPGFFLARIAGDQPNAPVGATLYCLLQRNGQVDTVGIIYLDGLRPQHMPDLKNAICHAMGLGAD